MMLLSFATLVVLALRVFGRRKTVGLNELVQTVDMSSADLFVDANRSENRSFDYASPAQRHEELGLTPISSRLQFEDSSRHNGPAMGSISSYTFVRKLKEFISAFTHSCSENPDSRFHMEVSRPEADLKVIKADPIKYWDNTNMGAKYIKTKGIPGCNGDEYNGYVCHVVFKLVIAVVTVEPLAGLAAHSKGEAFYMVCHSGRKFYGSQWSQVHTCHIVPEPVLAQSKEDGSFEQVSDERTTLTDWSCDVPEMANEVQEVTPVEPSVQEVTPVAKPSVIEPQSLQNHSSSEICCCAEVGGQMRAFGVQLAGTQGGSDVALAVGHSGWWSGTPGRAKCPVIGGLQTGGKPCACTVHYLSWKAPNTCKLNPAAKSHEPENLGKTSKTLECVGLCSSRPRSSITQECKDEAPPVEIEMAKM